MDAAGGSRCDRRLSVSKTRLARSTLLGHRGRLALRSHIVSLVSDLDGAVPLLLSKSCMAAADGVESSLVLRFDRMVDAGTLETKQSLPQASVLPVLWIVGLEFFTSFEDKD